MPAFNCFRLTASVSTVPAATFAITLPPLLRPAVVKDTEDVAPPAADGVIVIPAVPTATVLVPSVYVDTPAVCVADVVPSTNVAPPAVYVPTFVPCSKVDPLAVCVTV